VSWTHIFVSNLGPGTIGEYTTSGATVNASLISGLNTSNDITVSGSDIFVTNGTGTIGEYTTSGTTVNASLISGLNGPFGIAVSGSDIFVANFYNSTIGEYTTSGTTVNAALISGLYNPSGIAVTTSAVPEPSSFGVASVGLLAGLAYAWSRHRRDRRRGPMGPADPNRSSTTGASRES
jgi:hypothetical protein